MEELCCRYQGKGYYDLEGYYGGDYSDCNKTRLFGKGVHEKSGSWRKPGISREQCSIGSLSGRHQTKGSIHTSLGNTARCRNWNQQSHYFCQSCSSCATEAQGLKKAKTIEGIIILPPSLWSDIIAQLDNKANGVPIIVTTVCNTLKRLTDGKTERTVFQAKQDNATAREVSHIFWWNLSRESVGVHQPNTKMQNIEVIKQCHQICECREA